MIRISHVAIALFLTLILVSAYYIRAFVVTYEQSLAHEFQLEWVVTSVTRHVEDTGSLPHDWDEIEKAMKKEIEDIGSCPWSISEIRRNVTVQFDVTTEQVLGGTPFVRCIIGSTDASADGNALIRTSLERANRSQGQNTRTASPSGSMSA